MVAQTYVKKTRDRKFGFSSNSTTPKVSELLTKEELAERNKTKTAPRVLYTEEVWNQIWYLVQQCQKEVGWLGLVDTLENGDYMVTDIYIPEQEVCGTETDIKPEAMAALALELVELGKDPNKLIYWGHSHVNMGVSPSAQDEDQIDEYLEDCPLFIRGIYNKRHEQKVDVYDKTRKLIFESVVSGPLRRELTESEKEHLDKLIKTNVKETTYANYGAGYKGYNGYTGKGNNSQYNGFGNNYIDDEDYYNHVYGTAYNQPATGKTTEKKQEKSNVTALKPKDKQATTFLELIEKTANYFECKPEEITAEDIVAMYHHNLVDDDEIELLFAHELQQLAATEQQGA